MDPEVDLDVCANKSTEHQVNILMKNSFGFGGINSVSLIKKYPQHIQSSPTQRQNS